MSVGRRSTRRRRRPRWRASWLLQKGADPRDARVPEAPVGGVIGPPGIAARVVVFQERLGERGRSGELARSKGEGGEAQRGGMGARTDRQRRVIGGTRLGVARAGFEGDAPEQVEQEEQRRI